MSLSKIYYSSFYQFNIFALFERCIHLAQSDFIWFSREIGVGHFFRLKKTQKISNTFLKQMKCPTPITK